MLNHMFGWYVKQSLGGQFVTVVFEKSVAAAATGQFSIMDAINGAKHQADLTAFDYILFDVFAYAKPGFVKVDISPDADSSQAFRTECTPNATRTLFSPPVLVQTDLQLDYINEGVPNDIYLNFSALRLPQTNTPKFTLMSGQILSQMSTMNLNSFEIIRQLINIEDILQDRTPTYGATGGTTIGYAEAVEECNFCRRNRGCGK
jgi:hypothetical protein